MTNKGAAWVAIGVFAVLAIGIAAWMWMDRVGDEAAAPSTTTSNNQPSASNLNQTEDIVAAEGTTVDIMNGEFVTPNVKIKKGDTVTWTNSDNIEHSVVADDSGNTGGLPTDVQMFGPGETFSVTFSKAGKFNYHCVPHTGMRGTVEVTE